MKLWHLLLFFFDIISKILAENENGGGCPYDWSSASNSSKCYKFFSNKSDLKTWEDAKSFCENIEVNISESRVPFKCVM